MQNRIKLFVESQIAKNSQGDFLHPFPNTKEDVELVVPCTTLIDLPVITDFSFEGQTQELEVIAELKYFERKLDIYGTATYELKYQIKPY